MRRGGALKQPIPPHDHHHQVLQIFGYGELGEPLDDLQLTIQKPKQEDPAKAKLRFSPTITYTGGVGFDELLVDRPDLGYWSSLLKRYGKARSFWDIRRVHAHIAKQRYDINTFLGNCLVESYGSCGNVAAALSSFDAISQPNLYSWNILIKAYTNNGFLEEAWMAFNNMPCRDVISWNAMIAGFAKHGQGKKALDLFHRLQCESDGISPDTITILCVLDACADVLALEEGYDLHYMIVSNECEHDIVIGTALISMYGKCGCLQSSMNVFENMLDRDVIAWNAMITGVAQSGQGSKALELFHQMQLEGIMPNKATFVAAASACANLDSLVVAQHICDAIFGFGYDQDVAVRTALIAMFGRCRCLQDARSLFNKLGQRCVTLWNAMIGILAEYEKYTEALDLFCEMHVESIEPTKISFMPALNACANLAALQQGQWTHSAIIENGCEKDTAVSSTLIHMYGMCGSMSDAKRVFQQIPKHDIVTWNAMMSALAQNRLNKEVLSLYFQMGSECVKPDAISIACVIQSCASLLALEEGQLIHTFIIESGFDGNVVVGTSLIDLYSNCVGIFDSWAVFNILPHKNAAVWNAIIWAYAQNGHARKALDFFCQMQAQGIRPDAITFLAALDACAGLAAVDEGHKIFAAVVKLGYEQDIAIGTSIINMYGKCTDMLSAIHVFNQMLYRNVVTWNTLMAVFNQNGLSSYALKLFRKMQCVQITPDKISYACAIDACASLTTLKKGQKIHMAASKGGFEQDLVVGTTLLNFYSKCGCLYESKLLFEKLSTRNIVTCNSMMAAFVQHGQAQEALNLFFQMESKNIQPDEISFLCALTACRHSGWLNEAWKLFVLMYKHYGIMQMPDHFICMIDLLGLAGCLNEAEHLVKHMPYERTTVPWLTLLASCRLHGDIEHGLHYAYEYLRLNPKIHASQLRLSVLNVAITT